jgi:hypothetical protein
MMPANAQSQARFDVAASFLPHFFLENLAIRHDNSILITVAPRKELWFVPPPRVAGQVDPMLLHTFGELAGGIAELDRDIFAICTGNVYTTHENYLHRLDLRSWRPGQKVTPKLMLAFPDEARGLNGCCSLTPRILLVADTFAGMIWRVDLAHAGKASARIWMRHESMTHIKDTLPPPPQPGINGIRYAAKTGSLYYTSTGQKLFMRVPVDSETYEPAGEPEVIGRGWMADDFCIDEDAGAAFLTTHRENTIVRVPLDPSKGPARIIAGDPLDELLLGPSSAAWSRERGEYGRVVYVTTDGGETAPPPDGIVRSAKVLRMELL